VLEPLELRHVRVAVDDRRAIRKAGRETSLPARPRAGVVDQADAGAFDLHRVLVGEGLLQRRLVHVPVHRLDGRAERPQLLEERRRDEVPAVEDQVGPAQEPRAFVRQRTAAAREMRIGDDGDARQRRPLYRTAFAIWTVLANVLTRSLFVCALSLTATRYVPAVSRGSLNWI